MNFELWPIKKLLSVFDLNEKDFERWLYTHKVIQHHPSDESRIESLPDMAFRLRDEVGNKPQLRIGFYLIYEWYHTPETRRDIASLLTEARTHWNYWEDYARWVIMAEPKVFIVAALIAKEFIRKR